ncbi:MAG: hypothetical protein M5U34_14375 [Chloroflexi bacterium]|nr:hypothetical protein [Chloroflexota bacterium]
MTKVLDMALMGPLQINLQGEPAPFVSTKAQALLCFLAVSERVYTRQALAGLLWGDLPEADARRNLRGVVMKLRQHVGDYLVVTPQSIAFAKESAHRLDVATFRALAQQRDLASLAEAAVLYRGDFLEDLQVRQAVDFEAWVGQQREALRRQAVLVYTALAEGYGALAQFEQGAAFARRLLALEPAHEKGHRLLMRQLASQGQRSAALAQYEVCVAELAEMGVTPTEETAILRDQIRRNALSQKTHAAPPSLPEAALPLS